MTDTVPADPGAGADEGGAEPQGSVVAQRIVAGVVGGVVALILVCALTLGLALLVHGAHTREGCTGQYDLTSRDCTAGTGENGFLADWNATLWSSHGVGVSTGIDLSAGGVGARDTGVVTGRVPLGAAMLLVLGLVVLAGRIGALFGRLQSRADMLVAAAGAAALYYAGLVVVGVVATARGDPGQAVGPAYVEMPLLILPLAMVGFTAGMLRESRGPGAISAVLARLRDGVGALGGALEGAVAGLILGLVVAAVLAIAGMLAHRGDTANSAAATVRIMTSNPFPATVLATVTTVVLIGLALPGLALWMLSFGLVVPKIDLLVGGNSGGVGEHDLLRSAHDGWLWLALAAPLAAALLCGWVSARRGRSDTPRAALLSGAVGGAVLAGVVAALVIVLGASDAETISRITPGGPTTTTDAVDPLGALVEISVVGSLLLIPAAALGGRLALALVDRPLRLPVLRRWDLGAAESPEPLPDPVPAPD